jgi:twinkle protein
MENLLKPASAFKDQVTERFYPSNQILPGFPLMWPSVSQVRVLPSELSVWAGINGHGKSLILGQIVLMAACSGERTAIASFEMPAEKTLYRMVRQFTGVRNPSRSEIQSALDWIGQYVIIYDYVGRGKVEPMLENFTLAAEAEGCSQFVIDSLMKCGLAEDDWSSQKFLVEDFHNFAMKVNGHVHLVAHAKKSKDEADKPGKMDISGSGGITNIADNVYTIWRNKGKEEAIHECQRKKINPDNKVTSANDAVLACVKSREYGGEVERNYGLWYHVPSMQFCDTPDFYPMSFNGDDTTEVLPL